MYMSTYVCAEYFAKTSELWLEWVRRNVETALPITFTCVTQNLISSLIIWKCRRKRTSKHLFYAILPAVNNIYFWAKINYNISYISFSNTFFLISYKQKTNKYIGPLLLFRPFCLVSGAVIPPSPSSVTTTCHATN